MKKPKYSLTKDDQTKYSGMVLLNLMVGEKKAFSVLLEGSEQMLQPIFRFLMKESYVKISKNLFVTTDKGREKIGEFQKKYEEYLEMFDHNFALDLKKGEFAMSRFYDDEFSPENDPDGKAWKEFLADERWEDLRVAVAVFKKANPLDIVFMSYLKEGRFDTKTSGWETDLVLGSTFDTMVEVCNSSLHMENLGYEGVSGEEALRDIITQGTELGKQLVKTAREKQADYRQKLAEYEAEQRRPSQEESAGETVTVVETVEYVEEEDPYIYYSPWSDPYYVSPFWLLPLW